MSDEVQTLDLTKLASGPDSSVAGMVAELEGRALSTSEGGRGRTLWTRQFAASGKIMVSAFRDES